MEKLTKAVNVLNNIANVLQGGSNTNTVMAIIPVVPTHPKVIAEVDTIYNAIKSSCRKLINEMTEEETSQLDVNNLVSLFGEEIKDNIINSIKTNGDE